MTSDEVTARIAAQFRGRFVRGYVASKLRHDPVYAAALDALRPVTGSLFDIGCGVGLLGFFLREHGFRGELIGIDHDAAKIAIAREIAARYSGLEFRRGDLRDPFPPSTNVAALDVLHYFREQEQDDILRRIAAAVPPGGVAIIRDAVRDGSLRYRLTAAQETFSRVIRWLKAERLRFPTAEQIAAPFRAAGFSIDVRPLWGRTPFNNYLFVFRRPASGTTNE